jgi:hypothetical protein
VSDDYVVGVAIGEGLMGPRLAGRYRPTGHPVELEEIHPGLRNRPGFVERLAIACKQASTVSDAHVIEIYDLVWIGSSLYVVTEPVRGRTLAAILGSDRALPPATALAVVASVLDGLAEIHRIGASHGDVCPDTVVIAPGGEVRLTELGGAAVLAADPAVPACPAVQPPEGGSPGAAADLYATGALLRELVSGLRPEEGGPWPGPVGLEPLVERALAPDPAQRFPSAPDFRQALEAAAVETLGLDWRARSDQAARATRPLGPQAPRRRLARTVAVNLSGTGQPPEPPPAVAVATPPHAPEPPPDPATAASPWPSPGPVRAPADRLRRPPRRRPRRWPVAILAIVILVAAAAAALLLLRPASAPSGNGPLQVVGDVHLTVQPGTGGGCGTTFTFTATGSLSGRGTLTYQWVKSTAGSTPLYTRYSVMIVPAVTAFRFTTLLQLTGQATLDGTVTFQVLSPQSRSASQTIRYTCSH